PNLAEAYHDQASALVAAGRLLEGRDLLARYIELRPSAPNIGDVRRQLRTLDRARYSPATALGAGLIPGGGQFYTGRYLPGIVVAAATAGGVFYAIREETEIRTVTGVDPNGIPYQYEAAFSERPNLVAGLGIAAGATLLGALEAWWWTDRGQSAAQRLSRETANALRQNSASRALRIEPFGGRTGAGLAMNVTW